jgi:hypothetical protein
MNTERKRVDESYCLDDRAQTSSRGQNRPSVLHTLGTEVRAERPKAADLLAGPILFSRAESSVGSYPGTEVKVEREKGGKTYSEAL